MPVNEKLMRALKRQYGDEKGESVYFAMENEGHKATKPEAVRKSRRRARATRRQ